MDIVGNLRRLESKLAETVDGAAQRVVRPHPRQPLEVLHAIVECVEKRIEPAGRGKYVFPFNRIGIQVASGSHEHEARYEAVFELEPSLEARISERLRMSGCVLPDLSVELTYVNKSESDWTDPDFHVHFARSAAPPRSVTDLELRVAGSHARNYVFAASRVNIGRCAELRDDRSRLMRTNHLAVAEAAVSRSHAHIEWIDDPGEYRIYDDRSAYGTTVLRDGHMIPVPSGSRGVRLQTGDTIVIGTVEISLSLREREARSAG
jgi:FHA domain-containing protein